MNPLSSQALAQRMLRSPFSFLVRNQRITVLVLLGIFLGGLFGISQMPIESAPEVKIPIGTVITSYPGAAPEDIEKLITTELEQEIKNVDDVVEVTSSSQNGASSIVVEFSPDADLQDAITDLKDAVDLVTPRLPDGANDPIVTQIRLDDQPIVQFLLSGTVPLTELKQYADTLETRLEGITGVNEVDVSGLPERELQVFVQSERINALGISISQVQGIIAQNHLDLPAGSLLLDDTVYQLSLKGQFTSPEQLKLLSVTERNGTIITLGDIAEIREVFAEQTSEAAVYQSETGQTNAAIALDVRKKVGADLVTIVRSAEQIAADYEVEIGNPSVNITNANNLADIIVSDIQRLLNSALQTIVIIAITLFLALGFRESIVAALSIPILYLLSFIGLYYFDSTFNFLTFFALILSLGIVVDTSIVIIEGIYDAMENDKADSKTAALASIATFKAPLIAGSLTTIGAFLPLALMTGIMGEYVKHIPITMNVTLLASLFTALIILPAIASWLLRKKKRDTVEHKKPILHVLFDPLGEWYGNYIERLFRSKKMRRVWLGSLTGAFLLVFVILGSGLLPFNLFSSSDYEYFTVQVEAPEGTDIQTTKEHTKEVEALVQMRDEIKSYTVIYGGGGGNQSSINVHLVPKDERELLSTEITQELRRTFAGITAVEVRVEEVSDGPPSGADVQVRLQSANNADLQAAVAQVRSLMEQTEGLQDISTDLEVSPGEFHLELRRDRLARFGLSAADVGQTLRTAIFGNDSLNFTEDGEEVDIVVRLDFRDANCLADQSVQIQEIQQQRTLCRSYPRSTNELESLLIPTQNGTVALHEIANIELRPAITTIRHFNYERTVTVSGYIAEGSVLATVLTNLDSKLSAQSLPESVQYSFGGENEDTAESLASLAQATVIAIIIIVAVLTFQFGSFRQVLLIMLTIPLAFMGVVYGLTLLRLQLSFPGLIGLTALIGIVVNDAIVLVDRINHLRSEEDDIRRAIVLGCKQRLQPVLITTLTTALGVLPLIFSGDTFRDLAIVVAVGIVIATIFTLIVIPIMYLMLETEREREFFAKRWAKGSYYWIKRRITRTTSS